MNTKKKNSEHNNKEDLIQEDPKTKDTSKELASENKKSSETTSEISAEELLLKKQQEYDALWDKYLRSCAEFENIKKRLEREKQESIRYANEQIISELLNILDDLERTVNLAEKKQRDWDVFLKGIEMILAHLYELLKKYGVKPIEAEGKIFDPNFHEALLQEERDDLPEHTVIEELQKGYILHDKVIRTSKVKVSKKSSTSQQ